MRGLAAIAAAPVVIAIMARRPNPLCAFSVGRPIPVRMEQYLRAFKPRPDAQSIELTRPR